MIIFRDLQEWLDDENLSVVQRAFRQMVVKESPVSKNYRYIILSDHQGTPRSVINEWCERQFGEGMSINLSTNPVIACILFKEMEDAMLAYLSELGMKENK